MTSLYRDTSPRTDVSAREVVGFPIPEANMMAPVTDSDLRPGQNWPPNRVRSRVSRLRAYDNLYKGDFRDHVMDSKVLTVPVNYCERIPNVITSLLMTSDPQVPEADLPAIQSMLADAILNCIVYGRAYMTRYFDEYSSLETTRFYESTEGIWRVEQLTQARQSDFDYDDDGRYNTIAVTKYNVDSDIGTYEEYEWNNGTIEQMLLSESVDASYVYVDRAPVRNFWGSSLLDLIGPLVVELSLRVSGAGRTIAQNEHPLLVVPVAVADVNDFSNVALPAALPDSDKPDVVKDLKALRDHDVAWTPDAVHLPQYVEWGGQAMAASFNMMETLGEELAMMTGLPRALSSGSELPSGIALKRLLITLYASTRQLHNAVHVEAQELYGPFEWPHAFDLDEQQAQEMMLDAQAAMDNEEEDDDDSQ